MSGQRVFVVVTAAGQSRRMGGNDKLTLTLQGRPLLSYTVGNFFDWPKLTAVAVAVTAGREEELQTLLHQGLQDCDHDRLHVLAGGKERQDSIRIALEHLDNLYPAQKDDIVLIHDGARPFVDRELFEALLQSLAPYDGVIPATPVRDTIKRVDGNSVVATEDRETLRMVQTPQAFGFSYILHCHRQAHEEGYIGTDDASLVERYGGKVSWVPGPVHNLKVTVPEDIALLEQLLETHSRLGS